jgi:hypothetical protein
VEGSKNFGTHFRAYYHLLALEKFMDIMGIEYERKFEMNPYAVENAIDNNELKVVLYDNKLLLPVNRARNFLYYMPMKKDANVEYTTDHPLVAVVERDEKYRVCYGNRRMSLLYPQYFEYDDSLATLDMQVDGYEKVVPLGTVVDVKESFLIKNQEGYRVNVIGFTQEGLDSELGTVEGLLTFGQLCGVRNDLIDHRLFAGFAVEVVEDFDDPDCFHGIGSASVFLLQRRHFVDEPGGDHFDRKEDGIGVRARHGVDQDDHRHDGNVLRDQHADRDAAHGGAQLADGVEHRHGDGR